MSRKIVSANLFAMALTAVLLMTPASAWAHAQLEGTTPARGAVVKVQPKVVSFRFGEAVTGTAGAVRVYDTKGDRVDEGDAGHPGTNASVYGVSLKPGLPRGSYTATYRIVSADTHVVTGGFSFSIGAPSKAGSGSTVGELLAGQKTGTITTDAFIVARALQYAAIAAGVGLLIFLLLVWLPALNVVGGDVAWAASVPRMRILFAAASAAGVISAALALGLEGAEAAGVPLRSAYTSPILGDVLATRFGIAWIAAGAIWLVAGLIGSILFARTARPRTGYLVLGLPLIVLIALPAVAGHSSVEHPVWLLFPMNLIHVCAMSAWLGGLLCMLVVVPAGTRAATDGPERSRILATTVSRFSPLALICVMALLATGIVQSLVEISAWSQLLHTAYGRAVLIKIILLAVLIGLGAQNRQRTVPRIRELASAHQTPGSAGIVLRRAMRAEVAVIAVVLIVTGALSGYAPAKDQYAGPQSVTTSIGPEQLQLTVDPASVGTNEIHIYLLDPDTGAQFTKTKNLTVTASLPSKQIGPLPIAVTTAGPGHYIANGALLGAPGTWTFAVSVRVSAFDQYDKTVSIHVR